jgi:hypothetical protein
MAADLTEWRRCLLDIVEATGCLREGVSEPDPGRGRRVADLALTVADAAARYDVAGAHDLSEADRSAMKLAAQLHALVDDDASHFRGEETRLSGDALAAVEYRLRWIRETCRHRAMTRSVFDGGGFHPPADPSGLAAMDYALRASDVESVLDFVTRMNRTGPCTEQDQEWLGALARRRLETGEGPPVPYLTEPEHAALSAPPGREWAACRERAAERYGAFLERLRGVTWPEELDRVPALVEALVEGAGARAPYPARLLVIAERCERLLRKGGPDGTGLPPDQVLMRLRRDAESGQLDRDVVRALAREGLRVPFDSAREARHERRDRAGVQ